MSNEPPCAHIAVRQSEDGRVFECLTCGADLRGGRAEPPTISDRPEFHSEFYVLCEDPECHVQAFRFNGGPTHHYHFTGSPDHPADEPR